MVDVEPPEHKLQKVIVELEEVLKTCFRTNGQLNFGVDCPKLQYAIEGLKQADTRIAYLIAERDALYMKLLESNERATEAGWRAEFQRNQIF
jgi:hypothetical protein